MRLSILSPTILLAACGSPEAPEPTPSATPQPVARAAEPAVTPTAHTPASITAAPTPRFIAAALIRQQWAKAENRAACAPVAFTNVGGGRGTARAATYSGGWAVAFDQPGLRSAYGVAGPGLLAPDRGPPYAQSRWLARQWPYLMQLDQIARPSFAGYGLEGAKRYRPDNPEGTGENSLAYVRIHRQQCTYNVWSRLGRAHLELLLGGLRLLPPD